VNCQACGVTAPTRDVAFFSNVGFIIRSCQRSIKGRMCKACAFQYFFEYTLVSLLLGWWSFVSIIVNPFFLLNNLYHFARCLFMPGVPGGGARRAAGGLAGALQPHLETMRARLQRGAGLLQVAQEAADLAGVAVEDVYPFVIALSRESINRNTAAL
jgi:hypothetical protein